MEQSSGQFFDLFATRIWRIYLENLAPHLATWITEVETMRAAAPEPVGGSNRLGWNSSDRAVLHRPAFAPLLQIVRTACSSAFVQMGLANPQFDVESWININDRGGFNFQHTHNGLISGCFYLRVPPGAGNIVFRDPRPAVEYSYLKGGGVNAFQDFPLIPQDGLLILFPSWLQHRVEPHEGDTPRISLSFNAYAR